MAIGTTTLQTATFDAKFVTKVTKTRIINTIAGLGKVFKPCKNSPIFSFSPVFLAVSERANPPPEKTQPHGNIIFMLKIINVNAKKKITVSHGNPVGTEFFQDIFSSLYSKNIEQKEQQKAFSSYMQEDICLCMVKSFFFRTYIIASKQAKWSTYKSLQAIH